jgi:predicted lipoprotein with Yx(FWY)xxD motif
VGLWPAVYATGTPTVSGVTGKVATISAAGGKKQVTLNGWPLYYYAGDSGAGKVSGQGVGGIWWALNSAGDRVMKQPAGGSSSGGGGYAY